jgi:very-short-patch-repair endonuclease
MAPTPWEQKLADALTKRGLVVKTEYWDGHKTIDIALLDSHLYVEVDGLQHFTNPDQIIADFKRDFFSEREGFFTLRITNQLVERFSEQIAEAIFQVVTPEKAAAAQ